MPPPNMPFTGGLFGGEGNGEEVDMGKALCPEVLPRSNTYALHVIHIQIVPSPLSTRKDNVSHQTPDSSQPREAPEESTQQTLLILSFY